MQHIYLACSNAAANGYLQIKHDTAKILKNGIECDKFSFSSEIRKQIREELNITRKLFVIGHVGRFAYQKNHTFLYRIICSS